MPQEAGSAEQDTREYFQYIFNKQTISVNDVHLARLKPFRQF